MCLAICGGFSKLSKIFVLDFEVISDGDFRKVFYLSGYMYIEKLSSILPLLFSYNEPRLTK
jgi:hypothetical protein